MIADERGWLMELLRNDEEMFLKFGQVYVTAAYPGVVKAWHFAQASTHGVARLAPVACAGPLLAAELEALEGEAIASLERFGARAEPLRDAARFVSRREH